NTQSIGTIDGGNFVAKRGQEEDLVKEVVISSLKDKSATHAAQIENQG
ncbi:14021_t:CDS:2, partial [Gigaspora rosea]